MLRRYILNENILNKGRRGKMMIPTTEDFRKEIVKVFSIAKELGKPYVDIKAGDLHKRLGDYNGPHGRMPSCCNVMREVMKPGDTFIKEPPKGRGVNLIIRYNLQDR